MTEAENIVNLPMGKEFSHSLNCSLGKRLMLYDVCQ